nr:hypothetical protein [Tanacetum cinerariifolium]
MDRELRDNTFSDSDHEDANEYIEKDLKIVNLFHIPNITLDRVTLRAFLVSLTRAASHWLRNKQSGDQQLQQELDETLYQAQERFKKLLMKDVILFYNGLDVPTRQILDSKGAIPSKIAADAKLAIQEMAKYSQKWHNGTSRTRSIKTSNGLVAIQAQLNNLGREIKKVNEKVYAAQVGIRRDQVDNLMPTIGEGEVINEPMINIIKTINNEGFDEYLGFCDFDRKIHIDCAYNISFSCMIVENIDGYRDEEMRDIILGELFCKASCVEARRLDGLITIHNVSDNVSYQIARSHTRFKHLSNDQCNKIKLLLKVSRKIEEWLTRGHASVHEME